MWTTCFKTNMCIPRCDWTLCNKANKMLHQEADCSSVDYMFLLQHKGSMLELLEALVFAVSSVLSNTLQASSALPKLLVWHFRKQILQSRTNGVVVSSSDYHCRFSGGLWDWEGGQQSTNQRRSTSAEPRKKQINRCLLSCHSLPTFCHRKNLFAFWISTGLHFLILDYTHKSLY